MKTAAALSLACALLLPGGSARAETGNWQAWLDRGLIYLGGLNAYTVIYHKRELLDESRLTEDTIRVKFMKPFSVYLEWINKEGKGGEAIYVDGWNHNKIHTHPGGFWGILTFNLKPTSHWIMRDNRHPVTEFGLENLMRIIDTNVRRAIAANDFTGVDHGSGVSYGRPCELLEAFLPADRTKGYYCRRSLLWLDSERAVPLQIRNYDWADRMVEEYGYEDLRPNAPLSASDFDPANPAYRY